MSSYRNKLSDEDGDSLVESDLFLFLLPAVSSSWMPLMTRLGFARSKLKVEETLLTVSDTAVSIKGYTPVTGSRTDAPAGFAFNMCSMVSGGAPAVALILDIAGISVEWLLLAAA